MLSECIRRQSIDLVSQVLGVPVVFAAPPRSKAGHDRPFMVRTHAPSSIKSAAVPVPPTPAYGIVSAFLCSAKKFVSHPFSSISWFIFYASTGETHGCIRRCTEDAQRQRGQVRRPSLH